MKLKQTVLTESKKQMYGQVQVSFADWCESWIRQQEYNYSFGGEKKTKLKKLFRKLWCLRN